MTVPAPPHPVGRVRVLLGTLVAVGALAGVVVGAEALRHPHPETDPDVELEESDPRDELVCPDLGGSADDDPPVETVTSTDLYDCPATYDGRRVRYEGEVVGALLHRGDGAWAQLNDDPYAGELGPLPAHRRYPGGNAGVGVHLPAAVAGEVDHIGGPDVRGDVLAVTGTFHRVDPATRESAVIRADTGVVERSGHPIEHEPLRDRQVVGALLAAAAVAVTVGHSAAARRRELPGVAPVGRRRAVADRRPSRDQARAPSDRSNGRKG